MPPRPRNRAKGRIWARGKARKPGHFCPLLTQPPDNAVMFRTLNRVLFGLGAAFVAVDALWLLFGHFQIDLDAYGLLALLVVPLIAASAWYGRRRHEDGISAALAVTAFLVVFPAGAGLMSYLLITIAGPRIDGLLTSVDMALGFHWPALMAWAGDHPLLNALLQAAYMSVMPQTLLLILLLGFGKKLDDLYGLALALCFGAMLTLAIWTAFPSLGAFSVFTLPPQVASKLHLIMGFDYAKVQIDMLKNGPGFISPKELRGLVGFPSYHTLQALVLAWYARHLPWWRWMALALNAAVLVAVPIQGGHHLVDMAGGVAVTLIAAMLARAVLDWAKRPAPAALSADLVPAR